MYYITLYDVCDVLNAGLWEVVVRIMCTPGCVGARIYGIAVECQSTVVPWCRIADNAGFVEPRVRMRVVNLYGYVGAGVHGCH